MPTARTYHTAADVARAVLYKERLYQRLRGGRAKADVAPDPTSGWASPRSDAPLEPLSSEHLSALSDVDSMDGDSPVRGPLNREYVSNPFLDTHLHIKLPRACLHTYLKADLYTKLGVNPANRQTSWTSRK